MLLRLVLRRAAAAVLGAALLFAAALPASAGGEEITVRFDAIVSKGAPPLDDGVRLIVWSRNGERAEAVVARSDSVPAEIALPAGAYRVVAIYGTARRVEDVELRDNGRHVVDLRAGEVVLKLRPSVSAAVVNRPMEWRVHRYRPGAGKGREVARVQAAQPELLLREGWYEVEVDYQDRTVGHLIEVGAGQRYDYTLLPD